MHDVEASVMALTMSDGANTAHVTTTGDHANHTSIEPDKLGDLAGGQVDLDGVIDFDERVGITNSKTQY